MVPVTFDFENSMLAGLSLTNATLTIAESGFNPLVDSPRVSYGDAEDLTCSVQWNHTGSAVVNAHLSGCTIEGNILFDNVSGGASQYVVFPSTAYPASNGLKSVSSVIGAKTLKPGVYHVYVALSVLDGTAPEGINMVVDAGVLRIVNV